MRKIKRSEFPDYLQKKPKWVLRLVLVVLLIMSPFILLLEIFELLLQVGWFEETKEVYKQLFAGIGGNIEDDSD